ncbi:MAG: hypothetical protein QNJ60_10525 [Xenococcaceae cyanobacterium MO_188.B19]|nr:hypothetical protein [Xenococcaceae cyanobacterium MO_188.B19]
MYKYTAYGLTINSCLELPELMSSDSTIEDVVIRFGQLDSSPIKTDSEYYSFVTNKDGMYLFWAEIGTILISKGKEIIIDSIPDSEASRLRLFILGAAMGTLLHQRGYLVLHASAVSIKNNAVIFTADKGRGKSTMAAALHARGHNLIADDVVAIDFSDDENAIVYPAFPQLKLWPEAVANLGKNPDDLPQLTSKFDKREYLLKDNFVKQPLNLKQIFVLGHGSEITVKQLSPQEIIFYLIRNTYVTRFGSSLLQPNDPSHFLKLTKLAQSVSIERLIRPNSIELLSEVAQTVEEHLKNSNYD